MANYTSVLTIAGSDSGGCAGIQADIKSISACGGFAASVITATTAQNTQGVLDIHAIPIAHLALQLDAVLQDIRFGAVKIGMLHSSEVIDCVEAKLSDNQVNNIVLDPVMVASSGDPLINENAIKRLMAFLPKTRLFTPNIPEAEILLGQKITASTQHQAVIALAKQFNTSVLLKGGHGRIGEQMTDMLYCSVSKQSYCFNHEYIATKNTHGTGCSLSSAIATYLAKGLALAQACELSCKYIHAAIRHGAEKQLGHGNGPIDHFYKLRQE